MMRDCDVKVPTKPRIPASLPTPDSMTDAEINQITYRQYLFELCQKRRDAYRQC